MYLPTMLEGQKIDTDFRTWIKYEMLMQDHKIPDDIKITAIFLLVFGIGESPKTSAKNLLELMALFHNGGKPIKDMQQVHKINENLPDFLKDELAEMQDDQEVKQYCFFEDAGIIEAEFQKQYGFSPWDLEYYHWWRFRAHFHSILGGSFKSITEIRTTDLDTIKEAERRESMGKLQDYYRLEMPTDTEFEEFERQIIESNRAHIEARRAKASGEK